MDLLQACEDLAGNVGLFDPFGPADNVEVSDRERWQTLFGLTESDAIKEIQEWRADFTRRTISQLAWQEVSEEKQAQGFDKESYEYSLSAKWLARCRNQRAADLPPTNSYITYLVKLASDDVDGASLQRLAELPRAPEIKRGEGEEGMELFCVIDALARNRLLRNIEREGRPSPITIPISKAHKDLSPDTAYPTLGLDVTLPHNRPSNNPTFRPINGEYPLRYFVYGTLADTARLRRLMGPDHPITLEPAWILGGKLGTWAGKYRALVDDDSKNSLGLVHGHAIVVHDEAAEDALRCYETTAYEVVRCKIHMPGIRSQGGLVAGLTFRYVGSDWKKV